MTDHTKHSILLASGSPRRAFLLQQADIQFRQMSLDIDEDVPNDMEIGLIPEYLAAHKASHYFEYLKPGEIILAADCIVVLEGEMLGKPKDREEAFSFLARLSDNEHEVITGVCLADHEDSIVFTDTTEVVFNAMSEEEIEYYITNYHPFDKAGGYGIQDWIGWCKIREIRGSYSNIMGLPVQKVYHHLNFFLSK